MTITQHGVLCLGWFLPNGSCYINNDCVLDDASRVLWNRAGWINRKGYERLYSRDRGWQGGPLSITCTRKKARMHTSTPNNRLYLQHLSHIAYSNLSRRGGTYFRAHKLFRCHFSLMTAVFLGQHSTDAHGQRCKPLWCHSFQRCGWHSDLRCDVWKARRFINALNQICVYKQAQTWSRKKGKCPCWNSTANISLYKENRVCLCVYWFVWDWLK